VCWLTGATWWRRSARGCLQRTGLRDKKRKRKHAFVDLYKG
jgi:hypothetical protein